MINHIGLVVRNFCKSKVFYAKALAPIGLNLVAELPASVTGLSDAAGFCESLDAQFWISQGNPNNASKHIAFHVDSRDQVDDFYFAAIEAGGRDNGRPDVRGYFLPSYYNYYSAFVLDPDGHSIEAFCYV